MTASSRVAAAMDSGSPAARTRSPGAMRRTRPASTEPCPTSTAPPTSMVKSRRTESYWTRTVLRDADTGRPVVAVLLHSGVFKDSYPGYPKDRL